MRLLLRDGGELAVRPDFGLSIVDSIGTLGAEVSSHLQVGTRSGQLLDSLKGPADRTRGEYEV